MFCVYNFKHYFYNINKSGFLKNTDVERKFNFKIIFYNFENCIGRESLAKKKISRFKCL